MSIVENTDTTVKVKQNKETVGNWSKMAVDSSKIKQKKVKKNIILDELTPNKDNKPIELCPFCKKNLEHEKTYTLMVPEIGLFHNREIKEVKSCWNCAKANYSEDLPRLKTNPAYLATVELLKKNIHPKRIATVLKIKYSTVRSYKRRFKESKQKHLDSGKSEIDFYANHPKFADYEMMMEILRDGMKLADGMDEKEMIG